MIKKVAILPDVHMTQDGYSKSYKLTKLFVQSYKPDLTILLGDYMDCESLSHWNRDKKRPMEGKRWAKECAVANAELDFLGQHSKAIVYLEGNHEFFVERYLDRFPEQEGDIEIPLRLKLAERNIAWIPYGEFYSVGKMNFTHGMYINQYHAKKHIQMYGDNICYGHSHQPQTHPHNMISHKPYMAYGLGCLCSHSPSYMKNKHANWIDQFAIMEYNTKTGSFNLTPINITDNQLIWNGEGMRAK